MLSINRRFMWGVGAVAIALAASLAAHQSSPDARGSAQAATAPAQADRVRLGASGLPVPRFVSLKNRSVNVRKGPSQDHPVAWQFQRAGLPVEITSEFENWRLIRDSEGEEGWVFHSLLSGDRTAVVAPWDRDEVLRPLRAAPSSSASTVAQIEPQVVVTVSQCDGSWCVVTAGRYSGYVEQSELWGVYAGEVIGG